MLGVYFLTLELAFANTAVDNLFGVLNLNREKGMILHNFWHGAEKLHCIPSSHVF